MGRAQDLSWMCCPPADSSQPLRTQGNLGFRAGFSPSRPLETNSEFSTATLGPQSVENPPSGGREPTGSLWLP